MFGRIIINHMAASDPPAPAAPRLPPCPLCSSSSVAILSVGADFRTVTIRCASCQKDSVIPYPGVGSR